MEVPLSHLLHIFSHLSLVLEIEAYKRINFKRKPRVVEMNPPPLANYLSIELFQPSREKVNSCEYEDLEQPKPTQPATKLYLNSDSSNEDPIYDVCSSSEDLDCPEDDPYDDPYDAPICMTQSVGERLVRTKAYMPT